MPTGSPSGAISVYVHLVDSNRTWYNNKRIIILNLWILFLFITSSTNAYNSTTMLSFSGLPLWRGYFRNLSERLDLVNTIQAYGSFAALPVSLYATDGLGRRTSIVIGALLMCIANAIQTAATSLDMFIAARFLVGFGLTFAVTAAPILVAEIAYPAYRAPLTSAYGSFWYAGAIAATWCTFGAAKIQTTWSWRLPSALQLIPSVFQLALVWFAPESPRWLISKNNNAEALKILAYYHADGNEDDPLVVFQYDKIKTAIDREFVTKPGWKSLFANRKRFNVLILFAFSSPWYAYPIELALATIGITNPNTQLLITGILQMWNLFWSLLAACLVDKVGRRTLCLASMAGMAVFFSFQAACSRVYVETGYPAAAHFAVVFIFLFYSSFNLAFPTLILSYSVEAFPYSLRVKAITVYLFALNLFAIFSEYVHLSFGLGVIPLKYALIFIFATLAPQSLAFWFCIAETKNRTLEEAGTVFDSDGSVEDLVYARQNSTHRSEEGSEKSSETFYEVQN